MENLASIISSNKIVILTDNDTENFHKIKDILKKYSLTDLCVLKLTDTDKVNLYEDKIEIPLVFLNGFPLGGYENLNSMDLSGNLRILLKNSDALKLNPIKSRHRKTNIFTSCFSCA